MIPYFVGSILTLLIGIFFAWPLQHFLTEKLNASGFGMMVWVLGGIFTFTGLISTVITGITYLVLLFV